MKGYCTTAQLGTAFNTIDRLSRLNIIFHSDGMLSLKNPEDSCSVNLLREDKAKKNPFFFGLSDRDYAILGLAITQECQNDYIEQDDIDFVNYVLRFEKPISYEEVQEYSQKYI